MQFVVRFAGVTLALISGFACLGQAPPATNEIRLAGGGYRAPQPTLDVAPGQVIVLHVSGISPIEPLKIVGAVDDKGEFPANLGGVSVDLLHGTPSRTVPLGIRALYQTRCAPGSFCTPMTGITLQIPFEAENTTDTLAGAALRISEQQRVIGGVQIRVVTDDVHVLNTCDDTQTFMSVAQQVPAEVCAPLVMAGNRLASLYNLVQGGQQIAIWVYGMGARTPRAENCCRTPEDHSRPTQPFTINYDFRPNAPAVQAVPGHGSTAPPKFAAYVGAGLYQVNAEIPTIPPGLPYCDGKAIKSNLTVTITGPNSSDAAQLCVAP